MCFAFATISVQYGPNPLAARQKRRMWRRTPNVSIEWSIGWIVFVSFAGIVSRPILPFPCKRAADPQRMIFLKVSVNGSILTRFHSLEKHNQLRNIYRSIESCCGFHPKSAQVLPFFRFIPFAAPLAVAYESYDDEIAHVPTERDRNLCPFSPCLLSCDAPRVRIQKEGVSLSSCVYLLALPGRLIKTNDIPAVCYVYRYFTQREHTHSTHRVSGKLESHFY